MEEKEDKKDAKKQQQHHQGGPSVLSLIFSAIVHLLILWPVITIIELAFEDIDNESTFVWHPICMSLGAGLLLLEGVFAISGEAIANKKLSKRNRIRLHWISNLLGLTLLTIGVAIIILTKEENNQSHFASTHGVLGLTTFVLSWCVAIFGAVANNAKWFYPCARPILLKVIHGFGGIVMTILLAVTLVNGTFNSWWTNKPSPDNSLTLRSFILASFAVAVVLILVKPVIGVYARSRVLLANKPKKTTLVEDPASSEQQTAEQQLATTAT